MFFLFMCNFVLFLVACLQRETLAPNRGVERVLDNKTGARVDRPEPKFRCFRFVGLTLFSYLTGIEIFALRVHLTPVNSTSGVNVWRPYTGTPKGFPHGDAYRYGKGRLLRCRPTFSRSSRSIFAVTSRSEPETGWRCSPGR